MKIEHLIPLRRNNQSAISVHESPLPNLVLNRNQPIRKPQIQERTTHEPARPRNVVRIALTSSNDGSARSVHEVGVCPSNINLCQAVFKWKRVFPTSLKVDDELAMNVYESPLTIFGHACQSFRKFFEIIPLHFTNPNNMIFTRAGLRRFPSVGKDEGSRENLRDPN